MVGSSAQKVRRTELVQAEEKPGKPEREESNQKLRQE